MSAENSGKAAPGRPFKPGQSGNPGGRPKGLARLAREATEDGKQLIEFWKTILLDSNAAVRDRMEASRLLAERGFGKAASYTPVEGENPLELEDVDRAIGTVMDELAQKREVEAAGASANGKVGAGDSGATGQAGAEAA